MSIPYTYRIINIYPHDQKAFTQGLLFNGGALYESIGGYGESSLRRVELETGNCLKSYELDESYFGEGIALWQNRLIQLTWEEQVGFVYDLETFEKLNSFCYETEGWGITHDGQRLIMSDGTDTFLHFLDPVTFNKTGSLQVSDQGKPVLGLNELEFVNGEVFANVLPPNDNELESVNGEVFANVSPNHVAVISPTTGQVLGWIDLSDLYNQVVSEHSEGDRPQELNGIAYDKQTNRLFVTGKYWPKLFEIELIHASSFP